MKKWYIFLALVFGGLAFSIVLYLKLGQERTLSLLQKYGLQLGLIFAGILFFIIAVYLIVKYMKKKKKQREEAHRIDLRDLF